MKIPLFAQLEKAKTVLIAGAGGGFDIFCGLPLYFALKRAGKKVHLANLSFTDLDQTNADQLVPYLYKILPETLGPSYYFPELYLSQWLTEHFQQETPVYAISRMGAKPVFEAYKHLAKLRPDTLIIVDGGTDILMRGDESGLGTPQEDIASLAAGYQVKGTIKQKYVVCLGFGIDAFHNVCHAHFLENVAGLIADGGFLGTWSLLAEMPDFQLYKQAHEHASAHVSRGSIVNSSIISAVEGHFGDYHATKRTAGSQLFINPLMSLYWAFDLPTLAKRNLYLDRVQGTSSFFELTQAIERYRAEHPKGRVWREIPV